MSYEERDPTSIKQWNVFFALSNGERCRIQKAWVKKEDAEREAARLPEGKLSPVFGWKTVETVYPTCPKCRHQGETTGVREHPYNGGGIFPVFESGM